MRPFFNQRTMFWSNACATLSNVNLKLDALDILYQNSLTFHDIYFKGELKKRSIAFKKELSQRNSQFKEDELLIMESDYEMATSDSLTILSNFIIVASYSYFEKALKDVMQSSGQFKESEIKNCGKKDGFLKVYKHEKYIKDIEERPDYIKINELRILNNEIKHNGIVGIELHNSNPKWILKEHINNTYEDFLRLKDGVCDLLSEIISKTLSNIEN